MTSSSSGGGTALAVSNTTTTATSLLARRRSPKWDTMISQLTTFYKIHGHCVVTTNQNRELAAWCQTIRGNYGHQVCPDTSSEGRPTLSKERLQQLKDLNFVWNIRSYLWNSKFSQLCKFRAQHGHCRIPDEEKFQGLYIWAKNQRSAYRNLMQGKSNTLNPERYQALHSIGFWEAYTSVSRADQWQRRLQELTEFHDTYGHSDVPEDYAENYQLGQWVMNQRLAYKYYVAGLQSQLNPERIKALEAIQFSWNVHSKQWFRMLERLRVHAETYGHVRVTTDQDLKLWLVQQRHAHRRKLQGRPSSMTDQRQASLESIPHFEWSQTQKSGPSVDDWEELFAGIREKGIAPGMRPKQHWFEGESLNEDNVKEIYTDDDLLDLWNMESDDEDDK